MELGQAAFDQKDYGLAYKAARRTVLQWPFSDYAPKAQYLIGRCHEATQQDEKAFKAYQTLTERYPKVENYDEVIQRQFGIANRYLAGQWFKLWDVVPFFPSMDKTIKMYEQIIKNGPYSEVAPSAQLNIGQAHENKMISDYTSAAKAYERAADKYADQKEGTDALYRVGETYYKQASMVLDPAKTEIRYNSEWSDPLGARGMIQLAAKYTVARILERDEKVGSGSPDLKPMA